MMGNGGKEGGVKFLNKNFQKLTWRGMIKNIYATGHMMACLCEGGRVKYSPSGMVAPIERQNQNGNQIDNNNNNSLFVPFLVIYKKDRINFIIEN